MVTNIYFYRADGACRHMAATLYELEAFEKSSCTDGENQWMKRPRHHDIPVPICHLTIVKAKYATQANNTPKPHIDLFDPRLENQRQDITDDEKRHFALKVQEVRHKNIVSGCTVTGLCLNSFKGF